MDDPVLDTESELALEHAVHANIVVVANNIANNFLFILTFSLIYIVLLQKIRQSNLNLKLLLISKFVDLIVL
jgi:hypothetical protein